VQQIHTFGLGGHSGVSTSIQRIKLLFYWPSMLIDVQRAVLECEVSHRNNVYKLHGLPSTIVSDRDKVFLGIFLKRIFQRFEEKTEV